jgi:hypothetical protein
MAKKQNCEQARNMGEIEANATEEAARISDVLRGEDERSVREVIGCRAWTFLAKSAGHVYESRASWHKVARSKVPLFPDLL